MDPRKLGGHNVPYAAYLARHFLKQSACLRVVHRELKFGTIVDQCMPNKFLNFELASVNSNKVMPFLAKALKESSAQQYYGKGTIFSIWTTSN